jgi:hypothetical protein
MMCMITLPLRGFHTGTCSWTRGGILKRPLRMDHVAAPRAGHRRRTRSRTGWPPSPTNLGGGSPLTTECGRRIMCTLSRTAANSIGSLMVGANLCAAFFFFSSHLRACAPPTRRDATTRLHFRHVASRATRWTVAAVVAVVVGKQEMQTHNTETLAAVYFLTSFDVGAQLQALRRYPPILNFGTI